MMNYELFSTLPVDVLKIIERYYWFNLHKNINDDYHKIYTVVECRNSDEFKCSGCCHLKKGDTSLYIYGANWRHIGFFTDGYIYRMGEYRTNHKLPENY